jgi:3-hydroxybutyryl-CoA dehydrogenase
MAKSLNRVSVLGVGTIGTQIVMLTAKAGYQVLAYDVRGRGTLEHSLRHAQGIERLVPADTWPTCLKNVQEFSNLKEALGDTDLIIEAVPENLDLKRSIWEEIGKVADSEAIFATNSSSIPVSHLEDYGGRPEKSLNLHFYLGMEMADVMSGSRTLPEVVKIGSEWIRSLGLVPLTVSKEILGFCFNRVWRAIKREVLYMWGEGYVDFRDIDRAYMIFNHMQPESDAFGPFSFMDKIGLDVIYDIEMVYYRDSGDPKDHPPRALKDKIEKGELGVKTGKGFYTYPNPEYLRSDFLRPKGS